MAPKTQETLQNFIQGRNLSAAELKELKQLFSDNSKTEEINEWLAGNWEKGDPDDLEITYAGLKQKILRYEFGEKTGFVPARVVQLSRYYQRIAAFLFIPLIAGFLLYLAITPENDENFYLAEAPLGQKAKIELPDGSKVWLNSGSSIRYTSGFNRKNRTIELTGEAFFEVEKSKGKPFLVRTPFLDIEVTGTKFNVNVYEDEPVIETALVEGKVNLIIKDQQRKLQLDAGKVLSWSKSSHEIASFALNKEAVISWKENQLVFINDDFSRLVRKIEKWYDVDVIYNPGDFKDNKLTVRLLEGEQLDQLLKIIETAIGAKCTVDKNKIYIRKK